MTADQVNDEVAAFVQGAWIPYRATEVVPAGENVTVFLAGTAASIRFSTRGNLHHETCHLIIETPSSQECIEECIKEGLCDAYKFLKMQENGVGAYDTEDRDWFAKVERFKGQEIQAIIAASGDKPHDIIHGIPASRILQRFDTLPKLRDQLIRGLSVVDITDPHLELTKLMGDCWPLWKAMNGKSEEEKQPFKQQIESKISAV